MKSDEQKNSTLPQRASFGPQGLWGTHFCKCSGTHCAQGVPSCSIMIHLPPQDKMRNQFPLSLPATQLFSPWNTSTLSAGCWLGVPWRATDFQTAAFPAWLHTPNHMWGTAVICFPPSSNKSQKKEKTEGLAWPFLSSQYHVTCH